MDKDMKSKIGEVLQKGEQMTEHELRSVMILIRKRLESMEEKDRLSHLVLLLFCNWVAHPKIDQSNTGLRVLARINDALVGSRHSGNALEIGLRMSEALSFHQLRKELRQFLLDANLGTKIVDDNNLWASNFLIQLIEIIRDVPLSFPTKLDASKQKIYDSIAQNAIKPGAGVIWIQLSNIDFDELGNSGIGNRLCILVGMADTTTIVIPLAIDARL